MLEIIRYGTAVLLILIGLFFAIVSVFGMFRFKFILNRMHTAAIMDTLSIMFILLGLIVISGLNFTSVKLGLIIVFLWLASPVSSHLISNLVATVAHDTVFSKCGVIDISEQKNDESIKKE